MGYLRHLFQVASPSLNVFDDFLAMWTRHKVSVVLLVHVSTKTWQHLPHLPLPLRFHLNHSSDNPQYLITTILFLNQVLLILTFFYTCLLRALVGTLQLVSAHFRTKDIR
jgi:hypothetical protein